MKSQYKTLTTLDNCMFFAFNQILKNFVWADQKEYKCTLFVIKHCLDVKSALLIGQLYFMSLIKYSYAWTGISIHWTGLLDWTTGLDYWTGLLDWNTGLLIIMGTEGPL